MIIYGGNGDDTLIDYSKIDVCYKTAIVIPSDRCLQSDTSIGIVISDHSSFSEV